MTSGGVNIAPRQIEQLLRQDALIAEAMVYADRPTQKLKRRVVAAKYRDLLEALYG